MTTPNDCSSSSEAVVALINNPAVIEFLTSLASRGRGHGRCRGRGRGRGRCRGRGRSRCGNQQPESVSQNSLEPIAAIIQQNEFTVQTQNDLKGLDSSDVRPSSPKRTRLDLVNIGTPLNSLGQSVDHSVENEDQEESALSFYELVPEVLTTYAFGNDNLNPGKILYIFLLTTFLNIFVVHCSHKANA